jgi:hypothetical protein
VRYGGEEGSQGETLSSGRGWAVSREKQKDLQDKTIELTIALSKGGLYLTYAKPVRKRPNAGSAPDN